MFELGSHLSYRPLTTISFRFNHYFHELRPFGYHVVNIALHAAVTVLFTVAVQRMLHNARTAVLAGVMFAVHPLHVEVATNIIGRAESLAGNPRPLAVTIPSAATMCALMPAIISLSASSLLPRRAHCLLAFCCSAQALLASHIRRLAVHQRWRFLQGAMRNCCGRVHRLGDGQTSARVAQRR
jgi:hypothetical protein